MEEFALDEGESVITEVRRHIFVLFLELIPFVVLALLPLIAMPAYSLLQSIGTGAAQAAPVPLGPEFRFFLGIWWLFLWMGAFNVITKYYLTVWIITTHRIVDIEQIGFFRREVSSFLLARVQDVTTNVHGVFETLIGYGDINVQTAGALETFRMRGIARPEAIRDLIMREVAVLHTQDLPNVRTGL